jgi:hypothetical protein
MAYAIQLPDGTLLDGIPDEVTPQEAKKRILDKRPDLFKESEEPKRAPESGGIAGFRSSVERIQADYYAAKAAMGVEGAEEEAKKHREKAAAIYKQPEFFEHPVDYLTGLAGQSVPYIAAPLIAGGTATLAAPVLGAGALGTAVAGTGAAFLANAAQFTGSNLSRQLEEGKKAKDLETLNAVAAAIPQAALDTLSLKMMPGLGNILGKAGFRLGEREVEEIAKQSIIKQVAKTSGTEGLTESAQAVLERAQAGLNLTNEEARKEYFENFIGGALLGGVVGVPGHAYEKMKAQDQVLAKEYEAEQAVQKAAEEAAKISQTAVPNAQGVAELPTYTPLDTGAVGKKPEQVEQPPVQAVQPTVAEPPAALAALTKENVAVAYANNDVSTEKVRKALEPQLIEMGLDTKEEQKAYLKTIQAELGIPTVDPNASGIEKIKQRRAKDQWKANILTQQELGKGEENVQPPATINAAANKLGAVGSAPAMEGTAPRIETPNVPRVVGTGGDATTDNVAEGTQLATLTEEERSEELARLAKEAELAEEARLAEITRLQAEAATEELTKAESVGRKNEPVKPPPVTKITEPERRTIKLEEDKAAPVEQHTPEQAAFLQMKTKTRAKPAESIKEGIGYAAAEQAFDAYDSAYKTIEEKFKPLVEQENEVRKKTYDEAVANGEKVAKPEKATTLDILQKMPEAELTKLFEDSADATKLTQERKKAAIVRNKFVKSLSEKQQQSIDKKSIELLHREARSAKNIGRTTTEADLRKSREQIAEESVQKLLEDVEKPTRKVSPTKEKKGPTQVETLEQKRDATIRKALESGEVGNVFAAIANERINDSITAFFARKIYDVLKKFDAQPTIVLGTVEDGHAGKYDPSTETITIDLDNLGKDRLDVVVLHELTHYMADHVIDNRGKLTKEQQIAVNQLASITSTTRLLCLQATRIGCTRSTFRYITRQCVKAYRSTLKNAT